MIYTNILFSNILSVKNFFKIQTIISSKGCTLVKLKNLNE